MKNLRLLISASLCAALLAACNSDSGQSLDNPLLAHVPDNTPYVLTNMDTVPEDIMAAYLQRFAPVLEDMQDDLSKLNQELATENDPEMVLVQAVVEELDGKLNPAGLESLGISLKGAVFYGYGMLPFSRYSLSDPELLRAAIERIAIRSGYPMDPKTYQGGEYWRLGEAGSDPVLYAAIVDQHLALGLAPATMEAEALEHLLGISTPARSLENSNTLVQLVDDKDYLPYVVGYIDNAFMVDEVFNPGSISAPVFASMGQPQTLHSDPACEREARLATALVPRFLIGSTELTTDTIGLQYQAETANWLGRQLTDLVSDVSPASTGGERLASFAIAIRMGTLRNFLLEQSAALSGFNFQCPAWQDLNENLQTLNVRISQPMPPFIGNLMGMRVALEDIDPLNPEPGNARGMVSLNMDKPQMVIGMAGMMVPGFEELNIEPGADPVELPQEIMSIMTADFEAYAMMSNEAIGLSVGQGQKELLPGFMEEGSDNRGVFLSFEYDSERALDLMQASDGLPDLAEMQKEYDLYRLTQGITRMEFRFREDGVVIDQVQSFR